VNSISLSAWSAGSCYYRGREVTQTCTGPIDGGAYGPIVCPRPGVTSGSFTCAIPSGSFSRAEADCTSPGNCRAFYF
jgi:hypothetical protein